MTPDRKTAIAVAVCALDVAREIVEDLVAVTELFSARKTGPTMRREVDPTAGNSGRAG